MRQVRRRLGSRSVLTLQLAGFALVALPLLAGLIISGQQIDRVTRNSEQLLDRSLSTTQSARQIGDRVLGFERAARQYRVLRDRDARSSLIERHRALVEQLDGFLALTPDTPLAEQIRKLQADSRQVFERVLEADPDREWPGSLAGRFESLNEQAGLLLGDTEKTAAQELERLKRMGAAARNFSLLSLALTVPLAILLALLMAGYLNRRIRRLDRGMRALTRPEGAHINQIASPRDLRALSIRMEWVRRRLVRSERERRRLVGQVSHELKTPLSAIREGTSLLADQNFGALGREQREVVDIIQSGIDRLQEQIENLLRFNRLQGNPQRPSLQRGVRLDTLLDRVLDNHRLTVEAREIRVEREAPTAIRIDADPDMITTAIDNLVSNALKFSPDGGRVGTSIRREGESAVIRIADTGPGIEPRDRNRLFEPFFRGDSSPARTQPGTGLGLAICRDLVMAHQGDVHLVDCTGWSTVFEIRLPLKRRGENTP